MGSAFRSFIGVAALLAASAANATNWQREGSDSWFWDDLDSAERGSDGFVHYTVAIGCNAQGEMPATGADGVQSPAQCTYGDPFQRKVNCSTGERFYYNPGFNDPDDPQWSEPARWEQDNINPSKVLNRFPCSS